ncbi:MAG TPA: phosphoribosylglycinamide formyltransferase [Kutzneria sp.]
MFVSGSGTLLQALLDAAATDDYPADIVAVVADRDGIEGLARAERAGVPTHVLKLRDFPDRPAWDQALADLVGTLSPDLIVTAGFMKLLGDPFMDRFGDRVINSHPALSPAFPGAHAVRDALAYGVRVTGCTVFLVDNGVDTGPVVAQEAVPVEAGDDEATLHERIKKVERRLLVDVVARLARAGWTLDGRKVSIP